jgi:lipopolysaccharide heptosyltransferase II
LKGVWNSAWVSGPRIGENSVRFQPPVGAAICRSQRVNVKNARSPVALKILILKPTSLGDVVQALPVLRFLKRALPDSEIYWWIESNLAPLLEGDPDLAGVLRFCRQGWARPRNWAELWRNIQWMRQQTFDWVIDLQSLARSGAFAWLANGKLTIGLDEPREGARGFYDIIVPRPSFHTHAVDWYLGVLPLLGLTSTKAVTGSALQQQPSFVWIHPRPDVAEQIKQKWPVSEARWIAVQPGARWLNKRWPAKHFAELLPRLAATLPEFRFGILGSQEDCALANEIIRAAPQRCFDLTGQTSLPEMVELIRSCELMITNDTGPMHVAAALAKSVIALFGPTEPRRTGPYGQLSNVMQLNLPCIPCLSQRCRYPRHIECLRAISPEAVLRAVHQMVDSNRVHSAPPLSLATSGELANIAP